jgi:phenylalanyl-tRNA synthetase beta chain
MRPSVLPGLVAAAARNADRGFDDLGLFEVGPAYADETPKGQSRVAAGLRAGNASPRHWATPARGADAFDAKGDALAALAACNAPVDKLQITTPAPGWYHPGRSGSLRLGPNVLAHFGELHPRTLRGFELRGPAAGFEVFLDNVPLPKAKKEGGKLRPALELAPLHAVLRDFAFVVSTPARASRRARSPWPSRSPCSRPKRP